MNQPPVRTGRRPSRMPSIPSAPTEPRTATILPPWASLGLDAELGPELDPGWWPLPATPPDGPRPRPRPRRRPRRQPIGPTLVALVATLGIAIVVGFGLLRANWTLGVQSETATAIPTATTDARALAPSPSRVATTAGAEPPTAPATETATTIPPGDRPTKTSRIRPGGTGS